MLELRLEALVLMEVLREWVSGISLSASAGVSPTEVTWAHEVRCHSVSVVEPVGTGYEIYKIIFSKYWC